jgi:hypothetical protein
MQDFEINDFSKAWALAHEIMPNGRVFSLEAMQTIFTILSPYPLEIIKQAINSHMANAQFAPQPSDIVKIITTGTGGTRPSADEAWNELPKNEDAPCVWTEEMAQGWALVADAYYNGDKIGARMGFKACYERLCEEAKLFGKPVKWSFSHGANKSLYPTVIERAIAQGRLSKQRGDEILLTLPTPATGIIAGLITGKAPAKTEGLTPIAKENIKAILESFDKKDKQLELERKQAREAEVNRRNAMIEAAMMELPPEQQLALRSANLERYGNEVLH